MFPKLQFLDNIYGVYDIHGHAEPHLKNVFLDVPWQQVLPTVRNIEDLLNDFLVLCRVSYNEEHCTNVLSNREGLDVVQISQRPNSMREAYLDCIHPRFRPKVTETMLKFHLNQEIGRKCMIITFCQT